MKFEKGISASIAAHFDRMVTKLNMNDPMEREGEGGKTIVLHPRKDRLSAFVRLPNGNTTLVDNRTIVHSYDHDGKLIYRRRINEHPEGLEVDPGLNLPSDALEKQEFIQSRKKERGWVRWEKE